MQKKTKKVLKDKLLLQRREILKQHLNNNVLPAVGEPATGDAADAASQNDVKEMVLNLKESEKRALANIEEAITRIDDGSYGLCDECGQPIPEKRLLALPHAKYCVACQEKMEQEEA
jgi:DnaK suppressor protein